MSEEGDRLIAKAQAKLRELEVEAVKLKEFVNQIRDFDGLQPLYVDLGTKAASSTGPIRSDQFYGRPLATVVREILEMRQVASQGAASVAEIYAKLVEGGFKFDAANDDNAKRALRISLAKNPAFHKIPNGDYGLSEWYPNARQSRKEKAAENGSSFSDVVDELVNDPEPVEGEE
jgi:hypothetical protein